MRADVSNERVRWTLIVRSGLWLTVLLGHAISQVIWKDVLLDNFIGNPVTIRQAAVNSPASENQRQSVILANLIDHRIPLSGWKVRSSSGAEQVLSRNAFLPLWILRALIS